MALQLSAWALVSPPPRLAYLPPFVNAAVAGAVFIATWLGARYLRTPAEERTTEGGGNRLCGSNRASSLGAPPNVRYRGRHAVVTSQVLQSVATHCDCGRCEQ